MPIDEDSLSCSCQVKTADLEVRDQRRILAIDDDPLFLEFYRQLESDSCKVHTVDSPRSYDQSGLDNVDVVILDLKMPQCDGIEFLVDVLAPRRMAGAQFSLLVASGVDSKVLDLVRRISLMCEMPCQVMTKPFSMASVRQALAELDESRNLSARITTASKFSVADLQEAMMAGELVPFFQGQVAMSDGSLSGLEILARWRHPDHGLLLPGRFIKAMESDELAVSSTLLMLDSGLRALAAATSHCPFAGRISINVPARALADQSLPSRLASILALHDFSAKRLVCEVTENDAVKITSATLSVMARLLMMGCSLSVDDFGRGHSNIDRVDARIYDELKLDHSLLKRLRKSDLTFEMTASIVQAAVKAGLRVIGEGVESEEDAELLRRCGCTDLQGFLYSRPVSPENLRKLVRGWSESPVEAP